MGWDLWDHQAQALCSQVILNSRNPHHHHFNPTNPFLYTPTRHNTQNTTATLQHGTGKSQGDGGICQCLPLQQQRRNWLTNAQKIPDKGPYHAL